MLAVLENWVQAPGWPPYEVSDAGHVKRVLPARGAVVGRIAQPACDSDGYPQVKLSWEGKATLVLVHRLVAIAFIPNPLDLPEVNHKDGVRTNAAVWNLEWVTSADNVKHAYEVLNRRSPGGHNIRSYLAWRDDVEPFEITNLTAFAAQNGLHQGACTLVAQGKRRSHQGWHFSYIIKE